MAKKEGAKEWSGVHTVRSNGGQATREATIIIEGVIRLPCQGISQSEYLPAKAGVCQKTGG